MTKTDNFSSVRTSSLQVGEMTLYLQLKKKFSTSNSYRSKYVLKETRI